MSVHAQTVCLQHGLCRTDNVRAMLQRREPRRLPACPSVCPTSAHNSKIKKNVEQAKLSVNVSHGTSNKCVNFQLTRSKIKFRLVHCKGRVSIARRTAAYYGSIVPTSLLILLATATWSCLQCQLVIWYATYKNTAPVIRKVLRVELLDSASQLTQNGNQYIASACQQVPLLLYYAAQTLSLNSSSAQ